MSTGELACNRIKLKRLIEEREIGNKRQKKGPKE
jgi:hypothetical protein